ncbi:class I lanthipeptide [Taibaiella helva]|uniref:class I lanthipeptide n=1 Tax=Taibaiella helva TaxID=2301235 RepID=UPI00130044C1|nr:class I lanthipeptide [Taibaiella helva]
MKKKALQLSKKLVLCKDSIAPLNPEQLPGVMGGATDALCEQSIICPVSRNYCNLSRALSCVSQCPANCHTMDIRECVSYQITPGC